MSSLTKHPYSAHSSGYTLIAKDTQIEGMWQIQIEGVWQTVNVIFQQRPPKQKYTDCYSQ